MEYPAIDLTKIEPFNSSNYIAVNDTDYIQDTDNTTANNNLQTQINTNSGNISTNSGNISTLQTDVSNNTTLANTKLDSSVVQTYQNGMYCSSHNLTQTGWDSNMFGRLLLQNSLNSNFNCCFGTEQGVNITDTTGAGCYFGRQAGKNNIGSFCSFFGHQSDSDGGNWTRSTAIGASAMITASDQIVLGTNTQTVECPNNLNVGGILTADNKLDASKFSGYSGGCYLSDTILQLSGVNNVLIGKNILPNQLEGYRNTCLGVNNGILITNASIGNTMIGYDSGRNIVNNTNYCSFIGYKADTNGGVYLRSTALGVNSVITASDQIVLGTDTQTVECPNNLNVDGLITNPEYNKKNKSITAPTLSAVANGNDNVFLSLGSLNLPETGRFQISCSVIYTIDTAMTLESYTFGLGNTASSLNGNSKFIQYNNSALVINNVIREQMVLIIDNTGSTDLYFNGKMAYNGSTNGYTLSISNLLITQLF